MGWLDNLLSGGSGALLGAGAAGAAYKDISNRLGDIGTKSREGALAVGEQARADTQFQPFTVSTGFGGLSTQADGSTATALSPEMAAQQQRQQQRARPSDGQIRMCFRQDAHKIDAISLAVCTGADVLVHGLRCRARPRRNH